MLDLDKVLALVRAMNDERVEYVTFGAVALWAHGIIRVPIRVVTAEQLHEKRDTVRPKDRMDAEALRKLRQLEE